jgi:7-cyano-7-deazaguanine synthase
MTCDHKTKVAVLLSGGIDSSVLAAQLLGEYADIFPLCVRGGLVWEEVELAAARAFLAAVESPGLTPLAILDEPICDVCGPHWSTGGLDVPDSETSDDAVYLPGRNLLLTVKASVWCRLRGVGALALGCLGSNPFPDSASVFFEDLESVLSRAMRGALRLIRSFDHLHNSEVVLRARMLPLHLTFSCISPVGGLHCGRCNKCAERQKGFRDAVVPDRTHYASRTESRMCAEAARI